MSPYYQFPRRPKLCRAPRPMQVLQDDSPMPWGKHKGMPMVDVPASYLFWLWSERGLERQTTTDAVANYISRNLATLELDYPDGIWRK